MACLWSHNHLTSIRFSWGDLVGRNTNCILGWYLASFSFTLFDLCIDTLSSTKNICLILLLAEFPESLPSLSFTRPYNVFLPSSEINQWVVIPKMQVFQ